VIAIFACSAAGRGKAGLNPSDAPSDGNIKDKATKGIAERD